MKWIALACTAENIVLACNDSLALLESGCSGEFRAICRIFQVENWQYGRMINGDLNFRLKFLGARNTELVEEKKPPELEQLSQLLQGRVALMQELHLRLAHGYRRFQSVVPWQQESYAVKYQQAQDFLSGKCEAHECGFVEDLASEANLDMVSAARLIMVKNQNQQALMRKLERLRMRHQESIRLADSKERLAEIRSQIEEDSFISMLM
jgi:hypothetical protein